MPVKQQYNNEFHALLRIVEVLDDISTNLGNINTNSQNSYINTEAIENAVDDIEDDVDDIMEMMEWSEEQFQVENEDWTNWTTLFGITSWDVYELKGAYIDIRNVPDGEDLQIRIEIDDGGGWSNDCHYGETITVTSGTSPQVIPLADMTFGVAMRVQVKGDSGNYDIYYGYNLVERT